MSDFKPLPAIEYLGFNEGSSIEELNAVLKVSTAELEFWNEVRYQVSAVLTKRLSQNGK